MDPLGRFLDKRIELAVLVFHGVDESQSAQLEVPLKSTFLSFVGRPAQKGSAKLIWIERVMELHTSGLRGWSMQLRPVSTAHSSVAANFRSGNGPERSLPLDDPAIQIRTVSTQAAGFSHLQQFTLLCRRPDYTIVEHYCQNIVQLQFSDGRLLEMTDGNCSSDENPQCFDSLSSALEYNRRLRVALAPSRFDALKRASGTGVVAVRTRPSNDSGASQSYSGCSVVVRVGSTPNEVIVGVKCPAVKEPSLNAKRKKWRFVVGSHLTADRKPPLVAPPPDASSEQRESFIVWAVELSSSVTLAKSSGEVGKVESGSAAAAVSSAVPLDIFGVTDDEKSLVTQLFEFVAALRNVACTESPRPEMNIPLTKQRLQISASRSIELDPPPALPLQRQSCSSFVRSPLDMLAETELFVRTQLQQAHLDNLSLVRSCAVLQTPTRTVSSFEMLQRDVSEQLMSRQHAAVVASLLQYRRKHAASPISNSIF